MKARATGSLITVALAVTGTVVVLVSRSAAIEVAYPLENAGRRFATGVWSRVAGAFRSSSVAAENIRLRREVAGLSLLRGDLARAEAENARLRRALGYVTRRPGEWIAAGVLSAGGGAAGVHGMLRVDQGSAAGIRPGAVVVAPEGLVGRVGEVTPHTAEIRLLTDPLLKVACEVESDVRGGVCGILSGGREDALALRYVRHVELVRPHSRVLTSGRGGVFPAGIEVGALQIVTNVARGVECEVVPYVDFMTLEDVFIRRDQ